MIDDPDATWPDAVRAAAEPFLQGDLIASPPLFYGADLRAPVWALSRAVAADTPEGERGEELLEAEQRPPYGIITTQSCDIAEESPRPRKPWITVAPVYAVDENSRLLTRDEVYRINPQGVPPGIWVADLRIEVPLEKSVLVGRIPIRGFADEREALDFGNYLARRRGRPALASIFTDVITTTTQTLRDSSSARRKQRRRVRERVYGVRLSIEDGTRLLPRAAKLWVLCDGDPDEDTRDWFGAWFDLARPIAADAGLQLHPVGYLNAERADLRFVDELVAIRNPLLN